MPGMKRARSGRYHPYSRWDRAVTLAGKALRGGGYQSARAGRMTQYGRKLGSMKGRFVRKVNRAILRMADTRSVNKTWTFGQTGGTAVRSFNHDTLYECILGSTGGNTSIPTGTSGGSADSQRNGGEVYSIGFQVSGMFSFPFDRRNTQVKIWLVEYNSNAGTVTNAGEFFKNVTGNDQLDPINNDRFPGVRLLKTLRLTARDLQDASKNGSVYYKLWIPFKRKLRYSTNGLGNPVSGMRENLSLVMGCYDTFGALVTDTLIVDHDQRVSWFYKDL